MKNEYHISRRAFLRRTAAAATFAPIAGSGVSRLAAAESGLKMKICLTPGSIGVKANQLETIRLAHEVIEARQSRSQGQGPAGK